MYRLVQIGDIFKTSAGGTPSKSKKEYYEAGDVPWILSGEVSQGEIQEPRNFITEAGLKNSAAKIYPVNSVLVAMYGATAGQVGILRFPAASNQAVCAIHPNDLAVPEFVYYALLAKQKELVSRAAGNAQPNISQHKIKQTVIPLPPLDEQKRIVAILDQAFEGIDKAIANTEQNLKNAGDLFDSLLQEWLNNIATRAIWLPIGDLADLSRGHNPPKSKFSNTPKPNHVRFYQIRDGKSDRHAVYVPDSTKLKRVSKNDILMVAYRHIGGVFRGAEGAFNVALCKLTNRRPDIIVDDFLFHIIPTKYVKGELLKQAERSLIPSMSVKHLATIKIPVPPIEDQDEFLSKLSALTLHRDDLINKHSQKLSALKALKLSLLQKAFAGELTAATAQEAAKVA